MNNNKLYLNRFVFVGMMFVVTIILVSKFLNNGMSLSVDLAHHYTLVEKIVRDGNTSSGFVANLGETVMYSPGAHYMAAFLQAFTGSGLLSMNVIALLSIILIYFVIGYLLVEVNIIAFILGGVLFFAFSKIDGFPIIGGEVVGNYFYSQIVAQAFLIVSLVSILKLELSIIWRGVLFSAVLVIGYYVHPTFTVIFFGVTLLMLLLESIASKQKSHYLYWTLYLLAGLAIFWYHPYGRSMAKIAENNGWLGFPFLTKSGTEIGLHGYVFMCLCIVFSLVEYVIFWNRFTKHLNFKLMPNQALLIVNSILFSSSALSLLQRIVLEFGLGSLYAVKKYFFVMFTFLIIDFVMVLSILVERIQPGITNWLNNRSRLLKYSLIALFPILIVPSLFAHPLFKIKEVLKFQKQARYFHEFVADNSEYHDTVALFSRKSTLNYLVSIGDLEYPRNGSAYDVLAGRINKLPGNTFILSSSAVSVQPVKTIGRNYLYRSVDFNDNTIKDGSVVLFNNDISARYLDHGFSFAESWGTWTDGPESELKFKVSRGYENSNPVRLSLQVHPWLVKNGRDKFNTVASCQGVVLGNWNFEIDKNNNATELDMVIPVNLIKKDGTVDIIFKFNNLKSPKALGLSADPREMSLGFTGMALKY